MSDSREETLPDRARPSRGGDRPPESTLGGRGLGDGRTARVHLAWNHLALPQIAGWLLDSPSGGTPSRGDAPVDLSDTCVVLPGARAGRLLLWHLATRGDALGRRVVPPQVVTPGALVQVLAAADVRSAASKPEASGREAVFEPAPAAVAGDLARLCAVALAFERADHETIEAIAPGSIQRGSQRTPGRSLDAGGAPAQNLDLHERLAMARSLLALLDELGGAGRSIAEAAEAARTLAPQRLSDREHARWQALARIATDARALLAEQGLTEPMEACWMAARQAPSSLGAIRRLVLALTVELNALQRALIDRFLRGGGEVVALVHAPGAPRSEGDPIVAGTDRIDAAGEALGAEADLWTNLDAGRAAGPEGGLEVGRVANPTPPSGSIAAMGIDAFDELGCLRPATHLSAERWGRELIADGELVVADGALDACQVVVELLDRWRRPASRAAPEERSSEGSPEESPSAQRVDPAAGPPPEHTETPTDADGPRGLDSPPATIGLLDQSLETALEQAGRFAGLEVRTASGRAMADTETWRTLHALGRWLTGQEDVGSLARLPSAGRWMHGAVADRLDGGVSLVEALDQAARAGRPGARGRWAGLDLAVQQALQRLTLPLDGPPRPLGEWTESLRLALAELLAGLEPSPLERNAVETLIEELAAWRALPQALALRVEGPAAVLLLASRLALRRLPAPVRRGEIDALGWLELHSDDAPNLVLLGLHEGAVPGRKGADPLLPEVLRTALGLPDDAWVAQRDAYLLAAMKRGRACVQAVVARRGIEGDPQVASRLLLEVPAPERPGRIERLAGRGARRFAAPLGLAPAAAVTRFVVPPAPRSPVALERIRVTEFRDYLRCPYRYWLRHRLGLEPWEGVPGQLDRAEFGTLAHAVLQRWGSDRVARELTDEARLVERLDAFLDQVLEQEFAGCSMARAPVAMQVQVARLRERLGWFARRQARHRREGWHVDRVEWPLPEAARLDLVDEPAIQVVGRIDRIDRHDDGRWMLLDYKTADEAKDPRKAHLRTPRGGTRRWLDLQMPLYGVLASPSLEGCAWRGGGDGLALGYFNLSRTWSSTGVSLAEWTAEEIDEALDTARWVVSMIRLGRFELRPDASISSGAGSQDPFARICQTRALTGVGVGGDDDEEGPGA